MNENSIQEPISKHTYFRRQTTFESMPQTLNSKNDLVESRRDALNSKNKLHSLIKKSNYHWILKRKLYLNFKHLNDKPKTLP